jgi:hypothetical protein
MILEAVPAGASGWIAGLVNALPEESVRLFDLAAAGQWEEATALYHWFLPLLRMDTVPKFVQLIKLVQSEVGRGSPVVRAPRLQLEGEELRGRARRHSSSARLPPGDPRAGGRRGIRRPSAADPVVALHRGTATPASSEARPLGSALADERILVHELS